MRHVAFRLLLATALLTMAPRLHAQALSGLVRLTSGAPGAGTLVLAVGDSSRIIASTRTDSVGIFAMHLGQPGTYHLVFMRAHAEAVITPGIVVDTTPYLEREFRIPGDSATRDTVYRADDIVQAAVMHDGGPTVAYPERQAREGVRGRVRLLFVVDESGRVDARTILVVGSTGDAFTKSVREVIKVSRWKPARVNDRAVAQLVDWVVDFGCPADPIVGNVIVRSFHPACRVWN